MKRAAIRWAVGAALTLAVVVVGVWIAGGRSAPQYLPEVVWTAGWGRGAQQLGQARGQDGRVYGPKSFAPGSAGVVWILDSANARLVPTQASVPEIALSDTRGALLYGIEDVAVTPAGEFWAADNGGRRLLRRTKAGQWEETPLVATDAGAAPSARVEGVWAAAARRVQVMLASVSAAGYHRRLLALEEDRPLAEAWRHATVLADSSQALEPSQATAKAAVKGPFQQASSGGRGLLYALWPEQEKTGWLLTIHSPSGRLQREIAFPTGGAPRVELIGADRAGRICLGMDLGTPNGVVVVYSARGERLAELPAGSPGEPATLTWARVSPDGTIYTAYLDGSGYRLMRYAPR